MPAPTENPGPAAMPRTAAAALGSSRSASPTSPTAPAPEPPRAGGAPGVPLGVGGDGDRHHRGAQRQRGQQPRRGTAQRGPGRARHAVEDRVEQAGLAGHAPADGQGSQRGGAADRLQQPASGRADGDGHQQHDQGVHRDGDAHHLGGGPRSGDLTGVHHAPAEPAQSPGHAEGEQQRGHRERAGVQLEAAAVRQQPEPAGQRRGAADREAAGGVEGLDDDEGEPQREQTEGGQGRDRPGGQPDGVPGSPSSRGRQAGQQRDHGPTVPRTAPGRVPHAPGNATRAGDARSPALVGVPVRCAPDGGAGGQTPPVG